MKLIVDVDEADIGSVTAGQSASFRVDAYPEKRFASRVMEVRNTPKTANGVVTYQVVLSVDNRSLSLKPGMTATADITVARIVDTLVVPNAALRFTPPQPPLADTRGFSLGAERDRADAGRGGNGPVGRTGHAGDRRFATGGHSRHRRHD